MSSDVMIEIKGLSKRFGPFQAVDDISFTVRKGEVLGFLGPNGAGKSTTMKMITGFISPTAGSATVCGFSIGEETLKGQEKIGYLPEGAPAYPDMTPSEFLKFIAEVRGLTGDAATKAIDVAAARTALASVMDQPIDTLSKGFKRRVGLAQAILHDPPVLIMDEPTDGLDPNQKFAVRALIQEMSAEKAIIISTHILEEVSAVCSRAMIIDRGKIVADGTPTELLAKSRYHNSVSVTVAAENADRAGRALRAVSDVRAVEEINLDGGDVRFALLPKDGAVLIDQIGSLTADADWPIKGIFVEEGRMDEVFQSLTTVDASSGPSSGSGAGKSA